MVACYFLCQLCLLFAAAAGADVYALLQAIESASPKGLSPQYGWDGHCSGYETTPAAAMPCVPLQHKYHQYQQQQQQQQQWQQQHHQQHQHQHQQQEQHSYYWQFLEQACYNQNDRLAKDTGAAAVTPTAAAAVARSAALDHGHCFSNQPVQQQLQQTKPPGIASNLSKCGLNHNHTKATPPLLVYSLPNTLLEASLELLLACCKTLGPTASKTLYRLNASALLKRLGGYREPAVRILLQQLYGRLCQGFAGFRDEVLQDGDVLGLSGMVRFSTAVGVKQLGLEKLAQVLDGWGGGEFLGFCGRGGGLEVVYGMMVGFRGRWEEVEREREVLGDSETGEQQQEKEDSIAGEIGWQEGEQQREQGAQQQQQQLQKGEEKSSTLAEVAGQRAKQEQGPEGTQGEQQQQQEASASSGRRSTASVESMQVRQQLLACCEVRMAKKILFHGFVWSGAGIEAERGLFSRLTYATKSVLVSVLTFFCYKSKQGSKERGISCLAHAISSLIFLQG